MMVKSGALKPQLDQINENELAITKKMVVKSIAAIPIESMLNTMLYPPSLIIDSISKVLSMTFYLFQVRSPLVELC